MKAELDNIPISSKVMIKEHIQQIWAGLPKCFYDQIIQSMPNRMAEVIKNRGGAIHY